ncbi:OAF [Cordylochernes scorpioides]|uniref:OAF n=1 Tax=Cordylochernes scorpioides TaxID=51811 RepID=A0ABY6K3K4_9ARAC|nr:OAF [Cordylochernes scorpioides]
MCQSPEVQIFRVLILGEEEKGQSHYQVMCFVTRLGKSDFISADAMSKLRQRNPGAVRQPEEDRGRELVAMDLGLEPSSREAILVSPHLPGLCQEAAGSTFLRGADLPRHVMASLKSPWKLPSILRVCNSTQELSASCQCGLELCIGWFPCGLKYCRSPGPAESYRCGIKTCSKCRAFRFPVAHKSSCLWEDY